MCNSRPTAELHRTLLVIEGKPCDVYLTRALEYALHLYNYFDKQNTNKLNKSNLDYNISLSSLTSHSFTLSLTHIMLKLFIFISKTLVK